MESKYSEFSPDDRLRLLRDNADRQEPGVKYMRDLTQDELDAKREKISDNYIAVNDLEEELAVVKKDYKDRIEPLKLENREILQQIKTRKEQVEGTLFTYFDFETGMATVYDDRGDFVSSRRMDPKEKQGKLGFVAGSKAVNQ